METNAVAAERPDVAVTSNQHGVFTFSPMTLRAQVWLARNVPPEFHLNGQVVTGPLRAAQLAVYLGLEGLVII